MKAYIALGANLGDREKNLRDAIALLEASPAIHVTAVSSFYDNPAVGGPSDSPPFLNAAAEIETRLAPLVLLNRLLEIERSLGRERREKWGPRTLDLDLLLYGGEIISLANLIVPHPRLHERRFVLKPLADISPNVVVPGVNKTVAGLLDALDTALQGS